MRTTTDPEAPPALVTTSFAACASFSAPDDGSPVCDACGWLLAEHGDELAEVHALPGALRARPQPKRLAS